ncbi:hypothetical protein D3C72_2375690 [compost metagenome]
MPPNKEAGPRKKALKFASPPVAELTVRVLKRLLRASKGLRMFPLLPRYPQPMPRLKSRSP